MAVFSIETVLRGGGFATVVVARNSAGEQRALKVLDGKRCSDTTSVGRFRDEARILSRIRHPAVVRAHALHRYGDRLVMELDFVDGASLDEVLGPPPHRLPAPEAVAIVRAVADALWSAWNDPWGEDGRPMHIVHRDVHPANIMIQRDGRVRVLDFGIAKGDFSGREAMSLYDVGGAIGYQSPERFHGETGPPVDVYAVGMLLVNLLGHRLLLPRREARHDAAVEEGLATFGFDDLALGLTQLVRELLHYEPAQRPVMGDVVERLRAMQERLPTADLAAMAAERVEPLVRARPTNDPKKSRRYADVAFLEHDVPQAPLGQLSVADARGRLQRLLAEPTWVHKLDEVKRISRSSEPWVQTPLLKVLWRAERRWWWPFGRVSTPEEVEAALMVLGDAPSEATWRAAERLLTHPQERVRRAARFVSERRRVR